MHHAIAGIFYNFVDSYQKCDSFVIKNNSWSCNYIYFKISLQINLIYNVS